MFAISQHDNGWASGMAATKTHQNDKGNPDAKMPQSDWNSRPRSLLALITGSSVPPPRNPTDHFPVQS